MLASFYVQIGDKENADKIYHQILKIEPLDARASIALAENIKLAKKPRCCACAMAS
jgi:hypothetical protein